ncbi:MAG: DoxX family protein, partial [Tidjanibacter sp.]|nr:DoxX family protein [Tidjanibacter sp.]
MNRYYLTALLRVALGCVFLFSAVAKGVDPYGTVLKMGEYFAGFGVPILEPLAPYATVGLVALELWLG